MQSLDDDDQKQAPDYRNVVTFPPASKDRPFPVGIDQLRPSLRTNQDKADRVDVHAWSQTVNNNHVKRDRLKEVHLNKTVTDSPSVPSVFVHHKQREKSCGLAQVSFLVHL